MTDRSGKDFSRLSLVKKKLIQRRELATSLAVGWTSLFVQHLEGPARAEEFESLPVPDFKLVVIASGARKIESNSGGKWKKTFFQPGDTEMTASGRPNRLRLGIPLVPEPARTIHIFIPAYYFEAAAEEYRRAGTTSVFEPPDTLTFSDPVVFQTALSLLDAIETGAPNLYAEATAQFFATHLLAYYSRRREPFTTTRDPGRLPDFRLKRVLEFMRVHCTENLTLAELASEAGISRFHFITVFKRSLGTTPHQYFVKLRLERAAEMLGETDFSVQMIAASCGFIALSHFSHSFQRHFGQTATDYRRLSRQNTHLNKRR